MFPEWTWVVGLLIGASIGSFLNVVIYRMPRGMSLGEPKFSFCPTCRHRLTLPDLFPLLSWLVLGGRCRHCKAKIGARYFFVELLTGSLWAGAWWQWLIVGWDPVRAVVIALFLAALVAAIFIDLQFYIIPDPINAFMLIIGLVYNVALYASGNERATTWGIPSAIAGGLLGVAVFWGIAFLGRLLFQKDAMGHGDIKMARGIGAVLFPLAAGISFGLAVIFGAAIGILQILPRLLKRGEEEPATEEDTAEEDMPPESLGSLLLCGLGYLLCIDVIGLFFVPLYEKWFGENPYAYEDIDEDADISLTMIPFGPYLALGAIATSLFQPFFVGLVRSYLRANGLD